MSSSRAPRRPLAGAVLHALGRWTRRPGTAARLTGILVGAAALAPGVAAACSLAPPFASPVAWPGNVAFVGSPTADTVLAGTGSVRFSLEYGHFGRPLGGRPTYGQVVSVARLSPSAPREVAAAVRRAGGRVVLVPWDYAADCEAVPWARSARWVPDTVRGLFDSRLRDRAHWVNGMPTFDVFAPEFMPYVGRWRTAYDVPGAGTLRTPSTSGTFLTPDELLTLLATLPDDRTVRARLDTAFASLRAWAAAHPSLAAREPAVSMLRGAERMLADIRFRRRPVPLAGTYRVTAWLTRVEGGREFVDSSVFYARTEERPSSAIRGPGLSGGMYVLACAAPNEEALPTTRGGCPTSTTTSEQGYLAIGDSVWTDDAGRRVRAGSVDIVLADSAFHYRRRQRMFERVRGSTDPLRDLTGPQRYLAGRFTELPDGRVTFASPTAPPGEPIVRVVAERVSAAVIRYPADP